MKLSNINSMALCRHPSLGRVKTNMDGGRNMGGRVMDGVKNEGAKKRSSKTIDIDSYALKVSVNGVICVFVAHFQVIRHT